MFARVLKLFLHSVTLVIICEAKFTVIINWVVYFTY